MSELCYTNKLALPCLVSVQNTRNVCMSRTSVKLLAIRIDVLYIKDILKQNSSHLCPGLCTWKRKDKGYHQVGKTNK